MKMNSHGGNIYKKAKELGLTESQLIDFSANINPLGLPDHIREAMIRAVEGTINYPDPECAALREAIAREDGVSPKLIACGNGGADLLYRMAYGLKPRKVLLPVPAFVEYEEACTAAGAEMVYYPMQEDMLVGEDFLDYIREDIDLVILCNPNNPTGLLTPRDRIFKILDRAHAMDCMVMVDECFLEICQEEKDYTLKPWLGKGEPGKREKKEVTGQRKDNNCDIRKGYDNLMILKSFTKLYAIPGVRLGYMLCGSPEIVNKINRAGQAWSVSYIAQQAGLAALDHPEYKGEVVRVVAEELAYMKQAFSQLRKDFPRLSVRLYDGRANYLFFRIPGVTDLDTRLERSGIMIRNCSNYVNLGPDYWRVAVKTREENDRLIAAIREVLRV